MENKNLNENLSYIKNRFLLIPAILYYDYADTK